MDNGNNRELQNAVRTATAIKYGISGSIAVADTYRYVIWKHGISFDFACAFFVYAAVIYFRQFSTYDRLE